MNFRFAEEAKIDLIDSVEYYESCSAGFGLDLSHEISNTIRGVCSFPELWPEFEKPVRRALLHRFPYGLLYVVEPDDIVIILAVVNLHRKPDYWKSRTKQQ